VEEITLDLSNYMDKGTAHKEIVLTPSTPLTIYEDLLKLRSEQLVEQILLISFIPLPLLKMLAAHESFKIRWMVFKHPKATQEMKNSFQDNDKKAIIKVAFSLKGTKPEDNALLMEFTDYPHLSVRATVAMNPTTTENILKKLSTDTSSDVRFQVAKNPKTPVEVLKTLAKDENREVRRIVSTLPNIPDDTLEELAKDEDTLIRTFVAKHKKVPKHTLQKLQKDKSIHVRNAVTNSLQEHSQLL
jgi:hypothetical protein